MTEDSGRLRRWAKRLRRDALTIWLAARDPEVPIAARLIAALVAAYAFSPIDLIPDFIPVLGLLDDVLIIPAGLWLALSLVPQHVRERLRSEAADMADRPVSRAGLMIVLAIWAAAIWLAIRLFD